MNDRSEFYRRMTEYDAATSRAWVDRFLDAINALSAPSGPEGGYVTPASWRAPEPLLTADEMAKLEFLRWRVERGEVAA